jgi:hypothetical protein
MSPDGTDYLLELAKSTQVSGLPSLLGRLAEATAIASMRLLAPPPVTDSTTAQLVDRREAAKMLGVSIYFLENKTLPCQTRAGKKILYNRQKLEQYIKQGHVPYQTR